MTEDDYLVVRDVGDLRDTHFRNPETKAAKVLFLPRLVDRDGRRYYGDVYFTDYATQHPDYPRVRDLISRELRDGVVKCLGS